MNTSTFDWFCNHTWKTSAKNTLWCVIGCSIGDFGTILFFQAEDGIRDRSPSRGLGDVYKRQWLFYRRFWNYFIFSTFKNPFSNLRTVSYTHLTLPTKRIV